MVKEQILKILEEDKGEYISGEEIAERLSVSRNAIWKGINALKKDGHIIEAVTNRGYCLSSKSNVFTAQSVYANLSPELNERLEINILKTVGSTNTELKFMAETPNSTASSTAAKTSAVVPREVPAMVLKTFMKIIWASGAIPLNLSPFPAAIPAT